MKKILLSFLLFMSIISFSKAEESNEEVQIIYQNKHYTIYCIEKYKWLGWNGIKSPPQQMFRESLNGRSVPVSCK